MASFPPIPMQDSFESTAYPLHADPVPPGGTEEDAKWALLERILQSKSFRKAQRPADFLQYVCRKAISGQTKELSEQTIGEHVFARRESFDPGLDNIVRVTARRVRQKLAEYYADEGQEEVLILTIPVGGYIPRFDPRHALSFETEYDIVAAAAVAAVPNQPAPPIVPSVAGTPSRPRSLAWVVVAAVLIAIAVSAGLFWKYRTLDAQPELPANVMWNSLLNSGRRSIFVPGDSALVLFENHTHHPVALGDYISKRYLDQIPADSLLPASVQREEAERPYNSIVEVRFVAQLARLPEARKPFEIVLARDLSMEDLKDSNIILSGAREANPWVQMFQDGLDYLIVDSQQGNNYVVVNQHPANGEPATYAYKGDDPAHIAYAIVAYMPNLSGQGHVLLVQGTTTAGTEAATDFVLDRDGLNKFLAPHVQGHQVPPFQVLLETTNINGSSPKSRILSSRFH